MPLKSSTNRGLVKAKPATNSGSYTNQWLQNIIDLHKVQGVTPTPYTKTPWEGQYEPLPGRPPVAAPGGRQPGTPQPYSPAMPTASGDFISDWRNSGEYQRQFDQPGHFREGNDSVDAGGQALPQGSLGWDWNGNAYYGDGLKGAWSEFVNKIRTPPEQTGAGLVVSTADPLGSVFQSYGNVLNWAKQWSPVRLVNESLKLGLSGLAEPAKKLEQGYGAAGGVEKAGAGSLLPEIPSGWPVVRSGKLPLLNINIPEMNFDFLVHANPFTFAYNALRMATSPKPRDEQWHDIDAGYQAGRILYSAVLDPLLREEYIRRYNAGENQYLLQREMELPVPEMVGQIIYDPLNFIPNYSKAAKAAQIAAKLDDFTEIPASVARILKAGAGATNDLEAVQHLEAAKAAIVAARQARLARLETFATKTGLTALLARGKAFVTHQKTGEFLQAIVFGERESDRALEMMRSLYLLASDSLDEVEQGLLIARKAKNPAMMLSNEGMDAGIVLRQMIGDSPKAFLKELKDAKISAKTPEEALRLVNELAMKKLGTATEKMFPTLTARMKAAEEGVERLGFVNIKKLPWGTRALVKFDGAAQSMLYRPFNTFAAAIYMGMAPNYAFRNLFNNVVTSMIDEGVGSAAVWNLPKQIDKQKRLLGGALSLGTTQEITGFKGLEAGKVPKAFRFASDLANKFEGWTSGMVTSKAVERLMRKMLVPGRAIPDMRPLIDLGLSQPEANALWKLVVKNDGNVRAATEEFMRMSKSGAIDIMQTGEWIPDAIRPALEEFGLYDDAIKIGAAEGKTVDEKVDALNALLKAQEDKALRVGGEVPAINVSDIDPVSGLTRTPDGLEAVTSLGGASEAKEIAQDILRTATNYFNANQNAMDAYRVALSSWLDEVIDQLGIELPPEGRKKLIEEIRSIASGNPPQYRNTKGLTGQRLQNTLYHRKIALGEVETPKGWTTENAWKQLGMTGTAPTKENFLSRLWGEYYHPYVREQWNSYREWLADATEEIMARQPGSDPRLLNQAREHRKIAMTYDNMLRDDEIRPAIQEAVRLIMAGETGRGNALAARTFAYQYGISTATEAGVPLDKKLLNIINANLPEGSVPFEKLDDVPMEVSQQAIVGHFNKQAGAIPPPPEELQAVQQSAEQLPLTLSREEQAANLARTNAQYGIGASPPVPPAASAQTPSDARALAENMQGLRKTFVDLGEALRTNHGRLTPTNMNPELAKALEAWTKDGEGRMVQARYLVARAADAARKFTLHNYAEKSGFDLALAYIYPYNFWYSRTYVNWMKRIVRNPIVIADYAKYREFMAKEHAGAPDWWKYNINSNELLGIESDHPLFFNLEATLNPLNGLTGVDFNDADKRINWWTSAIDDMGKLGPSMWAPYQYAVATALMMQGEDDAAARWGGRLIPQTSNVKNLLSLANINIPTRGGVNEFDPAVQIFSGGVDPYESRRAGRALGAMVENGQIDQATALDAAHTQTGPVWRDAIELAIRQRAGNPALAVTNFMLGVGFKARNITDMQIDRMDQEWRFLWGQRDRKSPEVFQREMDALKEKYPFLETVILSRKSGDERDEAYAYNVLSRIPPGQKDDAAAMVGIKPELISAFYDTKGQVLATWKPTERGKFMDSIIELGAILDLPDTATRQEWNMAKDLYQGMNATIQKQWGEDMLDKLTIFYSYKDDYVGRDEYLRTNPDVQDALEYKDYIANNDPLLRQYYGSFDKVAKYYDSLMYDDVKRILGEDIFELQDQLRTLQLLDEEAAANFKAAHPELDTASKISKYKKANPDWGDDKQAERFKEEHPQLGQYYDLTHSYKTRIAEVLTSLASKVKEPTYVFRPDTTPETSGEINLVRTLNEPATPEIYRMSAADFENLMSPTLWRLTLDAVIGGEDLSRAASDQLDFIAGDLGISQELLLELIGQSVR